MTAFLDQLVAALHAVDDALFLATTAVEMRSFLRNATPMRVANMERCMDCILEEYARQLHGVVEPLRRTLTDAHWAELSQQMREPLYAGQRQTLLSHIHVLRTLRERLDSRNAESLVWFAERGRCILDLR